MLAIARLVKLFQLKLHLNTKAAETFRLLVILFSRPYQMYVEVGFVFSTVLKETVFLIEP